MDQLGLSDNQASLLFIFPEIIIILLILGVVVLDLFFRKHKFFLYLLLIIGFVGIAYLTQQLWSNHIGKAALYLFNQLLVIDALALFFKIIFIPITFITLSITDKNAHGQVMVRHVPEYLIFILGIWLGACFLVMANNLLTIYISMELTSIAAYVLVYFNFTKKSTAASLQYSLYGMAVSAITLFGMSWLYGFTGTLSLTDLTFVNDLGKIPTLALLLAVFFTFSGLLFKMSIIPYQFWAPDVYENAPTAVVAYLSVVPKLAAVAVLIRFFDTLIPHVHFSAVPWQTVWAMMAMLTIALGNLAALFQKNVKRMMAFSSIAQAGLMLSGMVTYTATGMHSAVLYSVIYSIINLLVFTGITRVAHITGSHDINAYSGLGRRFPALGIFMLLGMMALVGLPPTAGFTGKLIIFAALWEAFQDSHNTVLLALLLTGIFTTIIAVLYCLRIPYYLFFKNTTQKFTMKNTQNFPFYHESIMAILTLLLLWLFFDINGLMHMINHITFKF